MKVITVVPCTMNGISGMRGLQVGQGLRTRGT